MKELNEYTAEVMRRAEEKNRARKNALVKAVSLCAPLVLITVGAALLLPRLLPFGSAAPDSMPPEELEAGTVVSAALIQPNGIAGPVDEDLPVDEHTQDSGSVITDASAIDEIAALIAKIGCEGRPCPESDSAVAFPEESAIITLTHADGSTESYTLYKNRLKNNDTGESFEITAEQYARLAELFE